MKKILKHLLFSTLLLGLFGAALAVKPTVSQSVEAGSVTPSARSGSSGTLMGSFFLFFNKVFDNFYNFIVKQ